MEYSINKYFNNNIVNENKFQEYQILKKLIIYKAYK